MPFKPEAPYNMPTLLLQVRRLIPTDPMLRMCIFQREAGLLWRRDPPRSCIYPERLLR